jgi:hypothetical protein
MQLQAKGVQAVDPLDFTDVGEKLQGKQLGFVRDPETGLYRTGTKAEQDAEKAKDEKPGEKTAGAGPAGEGPTAAAGEGQQR